MGVSKKNFGELISYNVSRFNLRYFYLSALNKVLSKSKNLRADVLHSIQLNEAGSNLSDSCNIIFIDCNRFAALIDSALPRNDLVHSAKPYGFFGGLMKGY